MTDLLTMYTESPAQLTSLAKQMKTQQPKPLSDSAVHPDKDDAIAGYISRFNETDVCFKLYNL